MRTADVTNLNKTSTKITFTKTGVNAPKRKSREPSSFEEVLEKRSTPKREESKPSENTEPKKTERAGKRTPATKTRAKKPTDETNPTNEAPGAETVEQKQPEPTQAVAEVSTTTAPVESDVEEAPTTTQATPDDAPPVEQVINVGVAVGVPAPEQQIDGAPINAEEVAQVDVAPIDAAEVPPLVLESPEVEDPDVPQLDAKEPAAPTGFELPLPDETEAVVPDEEAGLPAAMQFVTREPVVKNPQAPNIDRATDGVKADLIGAVKPTGEPPTNDGEREPSNGDARPSNLQFAPNVVDDGEGEFADVSIDQFSFEPANAPAKHVDVNTGERGTALIDGVKPAPPVHTQPTTPAQPVQSSERAFAADNHANIVTSVRTNLLPNGGTMQIRLNPPELGAIQVAVQMRDGVMNASFETTSDQATRLLSHSLGELRTSLENSGVAVDKLHVEQAPRNPQSQNQSNADRQSQGQAQDSPGRREQERRELLQRMWRKLNEGSDPLDMVA